MAARRLIGCLLLLTIAAAWGCSYYLPTGPLQPSATQGEEMTVADDGSLTFTRGRLEVTLRPMTDEELNRLTQSGSGVTPYTYGDVEFEDGEPRSRFTVFLLRIKNYEFPKVIIDPARIELTASNGRQYWSLNQQQLQAYFRAYAVGYRGNEYSVYQERVDLLNRTMFKDDAVFSGQESEGYVVFPVLHEDVSSVAVIVHDAAVRFDYRGVPAETVEISYQLEREVGRKSWREAPAQTASATD